jgi:acetolactate synthase-1/2/3 large subunit
MWTAQFYGWRRPRQIVTSGGLGTMGFGCPSAIGAQVGNPGATVIDIDGDGSFSMTMVEVITAVQYQQNVKFVVLDNGYLGMVRQWQEMFWGKRYSETVLSDTPDFVRVAEAFGCHGIRVDEKDKVDAAIVALQGLGLSRLHYHHFQGVPAALCLRLTRLAPAAWDSR